MRVLIAGCGDVGAELGLLLAGRGHEIWGLRRRPRGLPAPIRPRAADLADPDTLENLPACDYVVYAAAAGGPTEDAYRKTYVEGLRNLLAALEDQDRDPRRVFFTSSTGVYGQNNGEWIDEGSPTRPKSFAGRILLEAERRVLESPFPGTVVRLAGIYGPGRTRLLDQVKRGEAILDAEPSYTNRIHRDDCAGFLAHLISMDLERKAVDGMYVGVDDAPAERGEVLRFLAELLGVPPPAVVPGSSGRGRNKRCRNDKLEATGYRLRFPTYREGYAAILGVDLESFGRTLQSRL
jgi:nucleoside-diphosphate-sugar epimerase